MERGIAARAFGAHGLIADGQLAPKRQKGPATFKQWSEHWTVFEAAMVSLRVATPVALEAYYRGIATLMEWYPTSWPEISLAEELVRKEQWARMLEVGLRTEVTNVAGEEVTAIRGQGRLVLARMVPERAPDLFAQSALCQP